MMRRLNYTGRRRIPKKKVEVWLNKSDVATYQFECRYDLSDLEFPPEARVFVEAFSLISYMRFDFGTVGHSEPPESTHLTDVLAQPLPKFRLKVVDNRQRYGLLLGVADQIVPNRADLLDEPRQSLLPVDFCDLGDETWRLQLDDWPVLELNQNIDNISEAARASGAFLGLVYPEVVRRVLRHALLVEGVTDPSFDDSAWTSLWLRFACSLPQVTDPPQDDGVAFEARAEAWIDSVVQAFCAEKSAKASLESALAGERG